MKTLATAFQSNSSSFADRLVYTSGLYCLITSGDLGYDRWDGTAQSAVECGKNNGLCTTSKEEAYKAWADYTANHAYK